MNQMIKQALCNHERDLQVKAKEIQNKQAKECDLKLDQIMEEGRVRRVEEAN